MSTGSDTTETDPTPPPPADPAVPGDGITIVIPHWCLIGALILLLVAVLTLLPDTPDARQPAVISGVLVEVPDEQARALTIEFNEPCSPERTILNVVEEVSQIIVDIQVDSSCGFGIALATTTLDLADPIGERSIVNAETGEVLRRIDEPTDMSIAGPPPGQ